MSVDLGPGVTQQDQLNEIETVVGVMESHFGEDYVFRDGGTDRWSPEHHDENLRPSSNCPGEGAYKNQVIFDYDNLAPSQAYEAAFEVAEELGLADPDQLQDDGTGETDMKVTATEGGGGRTFSVRHLDEAIMVKYSTRCSDDPSLDEAHERIISEDREERREERRRDREERLEQY